MWLTILCLVARTKRQYLENLFNLFIKKINNELIVLLDTPIMNIIKAKILPCRGLAGPIAFPFRRLCNSYTLRDGNRLGQGCLDLRSGIQGE